jgi:oligopeptide/dipeptide ABC transporter ATP-binding protein
MAGSGLALAASGLGVVRMGREGRVVLVEDVSLTVGRGQVLAIVGETGAGKTLTVRALSGLLPRGLLGAGSVRFGNGLGADLSSVRSMRAMRGREIAFVMQDAMGSFDPLIRVKRQLIEGVTRRGELDKRRAYERASSLLGAMGFADARAVMELFPNQLSGGMAQRLAVAMAMMPSPLVLAVDEPTSSLDAHVRIEVLSLLRSTARERGSAVLLISHDLGIVSRFADFVSVMYAGRLVEHGPTDQVLANPQHPYTTALLACSPSVTATARAELPVIPGSPPTPGDWPSGCVFAPRCTRAFDRCIAERPTLRTTGVRSAACHLAFDGSDTSSCTPA